MRRYKKIILGTIITLALLSAIGVIGCIIYSELSDRNVKPDNEILAERPIEVSGNTGVVLTEPESVVSVEPEVIEPEPVEDVSAADVSAAEEVVAEEPKEPEKTEPVASTPASTEPEVKEEVKEPEPEGPVDKRAPVFLYFKASPRIVVGNSFDVHKYIGYADDVDRHVDLEVQGTVDTNTIGTYNLTLKLTDDAGHTTTKNLDVYIIADPGSGGSSGDDGGGRPKENFSDFVANYKTDETMLGIDVSRWQGDIDFDKCKAAGCEFVYMRIGGYDEKEHYTDRYFVQNLARAKAAGMQIGIYWHAEESGPEEIKASVKYLMSVLNGEKLAFPIAYDWEDYRNFENYGMNLQDLNDLLKYFEKEVETYGYSACLYGSKNAQNTIWTDAKKNPVWLAHYTTATNYEGAYFMWQHSNTGRIDGIAGDVDLDVFYPAKLNIQ